MIEDVLYINGEAYDEPYVLYIKGDSITNRITGKEKVPKGAYFVLGVLPTKIGKHTLSKI